MTDITAEVRAAAIAAAVTAAHTAVAEQRGEAKEIVYKGEKITLPVARVSLDHVILNPRSHRIGAQVQSLASDEAALLVEDPNGVEAQALISRLLAGTDGFPNIKNVLRQEGQREEGVITDQGVLINANTRAVALRELGERYIKVIVLPSDATEREFNDIELRLQMARETKQDYNFTSQLLFIEDLTKSSWSVEEIGLLLRPELGDNRADRKQAKNLVETELRLLGLVRELIVHGDGRLKFTDLDDKRQALIEIDLDYNSMKNKNRPLADRVRDAQFTAMLSNIDYRRIRNIDDALLEDYLTQALSEETALSGRVSTILGETTSTADEEEDLGTGLLAGITGSAPSPTAVVSFEGLLKLVAAADKEGTVELPATDDKPAVSISTLALTSAINNAFRTALDNRQQDSNAGDTLTAPTRALAQAARILDNARTAYEAVRSNAQFDSDAFDTAAEKLQRAYDALLEVTAEEAADIPLFDTDDDATEQPRA
ncbi:hypothetical protein [Microbacterium hydrocarbonoxydans]|uniref:hypothetical protein n=1 Tax=Microbacterium hydrocarbonoxydans TaxID=273678 RepID=UPI003D95EF35